MSPKENSDSGRGCLARLHGKQKIQYIWDYYKLPIVIGLILLYIVGYTVYGHISKKEVLLYTGLVNLSAGEQLTDELNGGFLDFLEADAAKAEVDLYTGLYLTDDPDDPDHEYAYASRIKLIAAIDGEQLDVVLMNREAFDAFSQNGYLLNMEELLRDADPETRAQWESCLVSNTVILEDNADEVLEDSSLTYQAVTEEYPMGLCVSRKGLFKRAGFEDEVYLGVLKNSPRLDMAVEYIQYLSLEDSSREYQGCGDINRTLHRFLLHATPYFKIFSTPFSRSSSSYLLSSTCFKALSQALSRFPSSAYFTSIKIAVSLFSVSIRISLYPSPVS